MDNQSEKSQILQQIQQVKKAALESKKKLVLDSFWEFSKEIIGWKDLYEPLHQPLCDFVQNNKDKKRLILLPRGHLKSSVVTVGYCLWRIAQNPKIRILIANGTYPLAATFLNQIKDHIMRNEKFRELFGDLYSTSDKWADNAFTIKRDESWESKEATATAFGIGGNLVSQHYDLIILDDLVNRENIHTQDRIEEVKTFFRDVVDLFDNPEESELVMLGTRWHEADLYGWVLDEENPASKEFVVFQRQALNGEFNIERDKETGHFRIVGGELIFPNKFSRVGLERLLNDKGPSEFSAQYLNDPVPSDQAIFRHEFKYYEDEDFRGQNFIHYIAVDPAFYDPSSKLQDLDYTAFVVIAVNKENFWLIRDIIRERMQPKEILDMLFELDALWQPKTIGIETTSYQKVLAYFAKDLMRERNQFLPITELKHAGANAKSKAERIQGLEPRYAVGSILHGRNVRHITTLEMELRRFPKGKTDDVADALASMLEIAKPPMKRETREESIARVLNYPA